LKPFEAEPGTSMRTLMAKVEGYVWKSHQEPARFLILTMATSEITFLRAESSAEYYEIGRNEDSLGQGFLGWMCFLCYLKAELRVD
jgi:hypothetical protein